MIRFLIFFFKHPQFKLAHFVIARIYSYTPTNYDNGKMSSKETENTPEWLNLSAVM